MKSGRNIIAAAIALFLSSCAMPQINGINQPSSQTMVQSLKVFFFQSAGFSLASVDAEDQSLIEQAIVDFEQDIDNDKLDSYSTQPYQFSIQLLSGSEGNHFLSTEDLSSISSERQPAQAVVIDQQKKATIFKGEFENSQFFSAQTPTITSNNKTYILTLDQNSEVQAFQGKLLAGTDGNHISTTEVTQTPIQQNIHEIHTLKNLPISYSKMSEHRHIFNQLRDVQYDLGEGKALQFTRQDLKFMMGPPPPKPHHMKKRFFGKGFRPLHPGGPPSGDFRRKPPKNNDPEKTRQKLFKRRSILGKFMKRRRFEKSPSGHSRDPFAPERGKRNHGQ